MNYDIIGDIHGHADALKALLKDMGFRERKRVWRRPEHQALFVGDFIDRGPKQVETVDIVRHMVESGSAKAVMGNHEFNAIAWSLRDEENPDDFLRSHYSAKHGADNYRQHVAFLKEVEGTPRHREIVDWFLTLPLWLDLPELRVVHACWHQRFIDFLKPRLAAGNRLTKELMVEATREPKDSAAKDTPRASMFKAIEALTKGIETNLPTPHKFKDKDGKERNRVRVSWWNSNAVTYKQTAMLDEDARRKLPTKPIPAHVRIGDDGGKPIFIGHYWRTGKPELLSNTAACVDYSIALGGKLVAYRFDGGAALGSAGFHWVRK